MTTTSKLSLRQAIFININIMMGTGIFINTVLLAQRGGILGAFAYPAVGLLMLPLIACIAQLIKQYPAGGFYVYGAQELSPFWGFLSAWILVTSKFASASLMIHSAVLLLQQIIPYLAAYNPIALDCIIVTGFMLLNMLNMKSGARIQTGFMALKMIPLFFALIACAALIMGSGIAPVAIIWSGVPSIIPSVIYAAVGFETAASISLHIQDADRNGPRAIFISYGIALCLAFLFQLMLTLTLGPVLGSSTNFLATFPHLITRSFANPLLQNKLILLLHTAIAASITGGAYGILYSNTWNLYMLAQHDHLLGSSFFRILNKHAIPLACVLLEGAFCVTYLLVTGGKQITLQQIAALGCTISYGISIIALFALLVRTNTPYSQRWIAGLGMIDCLIFLSFCIMGLVNSGGSSLYLFGSIIAAGITMFLIKKLSASRIDA